MKLNVLIRTLSNRYVATPFIPFASHLFHLQFVQRPQWQWHCCALMHATFAIPMHSVSVSSTHSYYKYIACVCMCSPYWWRISLRYILSPGCAAFAQLISLRNLFCWHLKYWKHWAILGYKSIILYSSFFWPHEQNYFGRHVNISLVWGRVWFGMPEFFELFFSFRFYLIFFALEYTYYYNMYDRIHNALYIDRYCYLFSLLLHEFLEPSPVNKNTEKLMKLTKLSVY